MQGLKYRLFNAYYEARKNKRSIINQLLFEIDYEEKLWHLYRDIKYSKYEIGQSIAFIVNNPVKREIFAANFRDRIVHHLLVGYINPVLEPQFIDDSYSCRKGKETLYGIYRAYESLKKVTDNSTQDAYIMKLDIKGYFMSINKDNLYEKLKVMVNEELFNQECNFYRNENGNEKEELDYTSLFELLGKVIYNRVEYNCYIKGSHSDWTDLPESKSLFKSNENCGLAIGNVTSQLFSNVYLNAFDHYIKEELGVKYYGRYVDDFYIFHRSKSYLKYLMKKCKEYLLGEGLEVHPSKIYLQHYTKGVLIFRCLY
ncbi:hypothetical protein CMT57_06430 [Elizabethkingia anophelis]|uniref:RNA-directed DNA polymerase n=1 Tax=Elizabethkingia anophelis TaxID=1117645 RepID=UPI0020112518|nr:RNA-directed DNA polymerase [Elizabethkingia anophelis]MCL1689400.1 RNA-directed DNA polymerase [Elizabethkingia anophelis]MDV4009470.1 hypothetical protein [Elizabethkingia anophelis]